MLIQRYLEVRCGDAHNLAFTQICKSVPSNNTSEAFLRTQNVISLPRCLVSSLPPCAGYCNLPTSANDPSFQLVLHELRSPLLHTQLHPRDKVTSIRSQQTWQVQQPITVRLREALCQKASSSMRSSPVSGPSRVVKLLQTRSNTTTMKHDIERL